MGIPALVSRWLLLLFLTVTATFASAAANDEVAIPPLTVRVTDLTGTLSADQQDQLKNALAQIETAKGSQVAILMLPTTQPETIEQYGIRLADAWKVGRKGVDDGAIVIVAKDDHKMRIEVGYGLEGAIPDAVAKRIVSDIMAPRFKQGDFYGGLQGAVEAISNIINGEPLPAPVQHGGNDANLSGNLIPLAFVFVFVIGGILRALLGRGIGAGIGGTIAFFGAWLLAGSLVMAIIIAVITFIFTLAGGGRGGLGGMGGFGGGGFGSGGGGFSGGGGGFGGGGSSGSW